MSTKKLPLEGIKVIELSGLAPVPFCGMILSDFGAEVILRGKKSIAININTPKGKEVLLNLLKKSDILLDPYRPGTLEKLGLAPESLLKENKRLIIGRISGYGQDGPKKLIAGHDINYIAISGILDKLRRRGEKPFPPINLLGDFAGGSLLGAFGILAAVIEREKSGLGQVVDISMTDGARYLSSFIFIAEEQGMLFNDPPGEGMLDSGAPFYQVYETSDNKFMAIGAIEPKFYKEFLQKVDLNVEEYMSTQMDIEIWPKLIKEFELIFKQKTQEEWTKIFENSDACVTPVLSAEQLRSMMNTPTLSLPAPRLSRTPAKVVNSMHDPIEPGTHTIQVLKDLGYSSADIKGLIDANIVGILEDENLKSKL
ncbi:2-methylacyl-CoA racemase [Conidiobolus coronatus NRRL 28638]|uniref:2-methylacyl-CoA racemase n=1 Tax=Conidiobolus coronatus (strain ATCC 28846 / CBS 209.66 / NRRL 28638) TaxID=796925 RepID=A0A137P5X6_CONC2|nr:2-methylacyl-CoA racemase [Conidiobolus coronatus NRRL 28638]|eukprot:KXN70369.1 2-methylacyl-CoA racemase [Conidiobolus coronatus NRRL 28638]